jgi:hypothetical protein
MEDMLRFVENRDVIDKDAKWCLIALDFARLRRDDISITALE